MIQKNNLPISSDMANSSTAPLQTRNVAVLLGTGPHPRRLHLALRSDPDTFYLGVSD